MNIEENISLAGYSTFKTGGIARYFCVIRDIAGIKKASGFARENNLSIFVLGGGSNMLFPDKGFSGLVIKNEIMGITESVESSRGEVFIESGAGVSWDDFVALTVSKGYWGVENLSGIPGTVGASPVQNIGAYGTEVNSTIESVAVFDIVTGEERVMKNSDCGFAYRDSVFKNNANKNLVITSVFFRLSLSPKPNLLYKDLKEYFAGKNPSISEIRQAVLDIRSKKFPDLRVYGTAGSFWKNPIITQTKFHELTKSYPLIPSFPAGFNISGDEQVKVPLAWILDNVCGLKGFSKGKVGLFKNQPLVLVAETGAISEQINIFAKEIEALVKSKTGIEIEREVNSIL